jgi:NADH-quinone oxidoreductase subunit H
MLNIILKSLIIIVLILISVAYFTLVERKILGAIQRRRGPNVIGIYGLLQPLSDGFKLALKEIILPSNANKSIFIISPLITFIISLQAWPVIPFNEFGNLLDFNIGLIYIFAISSLGVYGVILAGWSSNSKYAFLGSLRSTAQMVSYEVSIGVIICIIGLIVGSYSLNSIIQYQVQASFYFLLLPLFLIFFICGLAETNRHPFDLPEAESELVSGYNVEYSSMTFAFFSLGEYSNMLIMSALNSILFCGGWLTCGLSVKICVFVLLFIIMRAALPRYRYDQLMNLGWKVFVPLTLTFYVFFFSFMIIFNNQPY